jgi:hypothetical protein
MIKKLRSQSYAQKWEQEGGKNNQLSKTAEDLESGTKDFKRLTNIGG